MRTILALAFIVPLGVLPAKAQSFSDNYPQGPAHTAAPAMTFGMFSFPPYGQPVYMDRHAHGRGGGSASRSCLAADTRAVLGRMEAQFGAVRVISTCRRGAVIAGTRRPSQHRYGKAVDFVPPPGHRTAILGWLRANAAGAVITYRSGHIHFDTGGNRTFACAECGSRNYRRSHASARRR